MQRGRVCGYGIAHSVQLPSAGARDLKCRVARTSTDESQVAVGALENPQVVVADLHVDFVNRAEALEGEGGLGATRPRAIPGPKKAARSVVKFHRTIAQVGTVRERQSRKSGDVKERAREGLETTRLW